MRVDLPVTRRLLAAAGALLVCVPLGADAARGSPATGRSAAADVRTQIVESSLRDLSSSNTQSSPTIRNTPGAPPCVMCGDRTQLPEPDRPDAQARVDAARTSNLHRLRRETVYQRNPDGQQNRAQEAVERAADPASGGR